jgi:hypothetical protein
VNKGSSVYRSCFEQPAFDWKKLRSVYLCTLHIFVLTIQIFKKVTDLNKILHDHGASIIPKLVHLIVSTISNYDVGASTVTTKNVVLKLYRIRDLNVGCNWFIDILCRNSSHCLPKPCLNTLCQ